MNFKYQAAIARAFGRFVEQGLVYKGKKPVHWCIHCRTALAEAEVEYEDHVSPSIYVEFPLASDSPPSSAHVCRRWLAKTSRCSSGRRRLGRFPPTWRSRFIPSSSYAAYDVDGRAVIVAEALAPKVGEAVGQILRRASGANERRAARADPFPTSAVLARLARGVGRLRHAGRRDRRSAHCARSRQRRLQHGHEIRPGHLRADRAGRTLPRHRRDVRRPARVRREPEGRRGAQEPRAALAS